MASCQGCKLLEEYKYWHEFPRTKQRFSNIMLGNFENQLAIPTKFMECFRGKISSFCMLKGPSGNVWSVELRREPSSTLFSDGWEQFVKHHGIKDSDFLIFCYTGNSIFDVSIFNATGCESEASYFAQNTSSSSCMACRSILHDKRDSDDEESMLESSKEEDKEEEEDSVFEMSKEEEQEEEGSEEVRDSPIRSMTSRAKQCQRQSYYVSNRIAVTQQERKRASNLADEYIMSRNENTEAPAISITMLRTHVTVGLRLTLPKAWAVLHMIRTSHDVELRVQGAEKVRSVVGCRWNRANQCQFIPGWHKFVLDNNLEEHDVCVFELVRKSEPGSTRNPLFIVHIFRVIAKTVPLTVKRRNMSSLLSRVWSLPFEVLVSKLWLTLISTP